MGSAFFTEQWHVSIHFLTDYVEQITFDSWYLLRTDTFLEDLS